MAVDELARWYSQASQEARFAVWETAIKENSPPLARLRLAAILAEIESGQVCEG